jgi:hypothetical protein
MPEDPLNLLTEYEEINFFHKLEVFRKKTHKSNEIYAF